MHADYRTLRHPIALDIINLGLIFTEIALTLQVTRVSTAKLFHKAISLCLIHGKSVALSVPASPALSNLSFVILALLRQDLLAFTPAFCATERR